MSFVRSLLKWLFGRRNHIASTKPPTQILDDRRDGIRTANDGRAAHADCGAPDRHGTRHHQHPIPRSTNRSIRPRLGNISAFAVGRLLPASSNNNDINQGDILGFLTARPKPSCGEWPACSSSTSATYDDSTDTVTLIPRGAWSALRTFRFIKVFGVGTNAITDAAGNPLNGGLNTYVHWFPHLGKVFSYTDADGDIVQYAPSKRPGQIVAFLQTNAEHAPTIFILNGKSNSVLDGSVVQARTGDGVAVIP